MKDTKGYKTWENLYSLPSDNQILLIEGNDDSFSSVTTDWNPLMSKEWGQQNI